MAKKNRGKVKGGTYSPQLQDASTNTQILYKIAECVLRIEKLLQGGESKE